VRALCTIDPTSSVVKDYGDELAHSHTALMPTLSMEATADLLDIPATMPMCSAGAMSDASNPAVSQTFLLLDADPRTDVSAVDQIHTLVFKGAVVDRNAMGRTN
jgi:hypothetical protein